MLANLVYMDITNHKATLQEYRKDATEHLVHRSGLGVAGEYVSNALNIHLMMGLGLGVAGRNATSNYYPDSILDFVACDRY
jgi:hypothetical protein